MDDIEYKGYIRYIVPAPAKKREVRTSTVASRTTTTATVTTLPSSVITCLQYNAIVGFESRIITCSKCCYYLQDKLAISKVFKLKNNLPQKPVPLRLQCEWPLIPTDILQSVTPTSPLHSPNSTGRHIRFDGGLAVLSASHRDTSPLRNDSNNYNNDSSPLLVGGRNTKKRKCCDGSSTSSITAESESVTSRKEKRKKKRKRVSSITTTTTTPVNSITTLPVVAPPITTPPPLPPIPPPLISSIDFNRQLKDVKKDRLISMIIRLKKKEELAANYEITISKLTATHKKEICNRETTISDLRLELKESAVTTKDIWKEKQKTESVLRSQLLVERKRNDKFQSANSKRMIEIRTSAAKAKKESKQYQVTVSNLLQRLEAIKRKVYNDGVSHGIEHQQQIARQAATNDHLQLTLPFLLDAKSLSESIDRIFDVVEPTKRPRVRGNLLAQAVWHMYDGQCKANFLEWSEEIIRSNNPYRKAEEIAKIMDLSPGQLNLSGYDALRQGIEKKNKKGKIPQGKGWLCSRYYVQQAQYAIERAAENKMPYTELENVDGFVFDYEKSTKYINDQVLKLAEVAKDPTQPAILIGCTLDGVRVSANVVLIIAGTKVLDPRATDPRTGEYVSLFQSPFLCFPMKVVVCADNKSSYKEHFADFFEFFNNIHEKQIGEYPAGTFYSAWPQDGSSVWKATGRGGACKNHIEFCSYCPCKSEECANPRRIPCDHCKATGEKECLHWRVGDEATMAKYQQSLDKLDRKFPFINGNPSSRFKIKLRYEPDELDKENDPTSIFFEPKTKRQTDKFSDKVNKDLGTLGYSCLGSINERKKKLVKALKAINRFEEATIGLDACTYQGALIQIRQAIPCILHLENRCGEKFIKMILKEVLQQQNKTPKQENEFITAFENLVNSEILGQPNRQSNWKLPKSKKDKKLVVGDLTMPCPNVRKFLKKFDKITTLAFPDDPARKEAWDHCIELWQTLIRDANNHQDFTNEDIDAFQNLCDEWGKLWLDLIPGDEGMTNYIHMIVAGHLKYYLQEWRNLYRFSQQGWEGLNSVIKSVLHNRGQGGGNAGSGKGQRKTSKVEAVVRWCLRRNFFLSGDYKLVVYLKQKFSNKK